MAEPRLESTSPMKGASSPATGDTDMDMHRKAAGQRGRPACARTARRGWDRSEATSPWSEAKIDIYFKAREE